MPRISVRLMLFALCGAFVAQASCDAVGHLRGGGKTTFRGDSALAYAAAQVAFGPRVPGSAAARAAGDWIVAQMRARADSVDVQAWTHVTQRGDTLHLRNIMAHFRPALTNRVLYLTHWDTRPTADNDMNLGARQRPIPGANDGAAGVGLFIALADALKRAPPDVGVDLLVVDGEDYGAFEDWADTTKNRDVLIGSQYFGRHLPASYRPMFGVLFDMIGDKSLQIYQESNSVNAAPEVVSRVWNTATDLGYQKFFIPQVKLAITDDHLPLIRAGLHVIDVIDIDYCNDGGVDCEQTPRDMHHTQQDTMDKVSAQSLQIVGDVALTLVTK